MFLIAFQREIDQKIIGRIVKNVHQLSTALVLGQHFRSTVAAETGF